VSSGNRYVPTTEVNAVGMLALLMVENRKVQRRIASSCMIFIPIFIKIRWKLLREADMWALKFVLFWNVMPSSENSEEGGSSYKYLSAKVCFP
jgi:hypothetical protein